MFPIAPPTLLDGGVFFAPRAGGKGVKRGQLKDIVSVRKRPPSVEDRAVPGHWEGDLIGGSRNNYIATRDYQEFRV